MLYIQGDNHRSLENNRKESLVKVLGKWQYLLQSGIV
jgi:hypothetical protein